jgi:ribonuclease HII
MSAALFEFDRSLGSRYVCGADEVGCACWAGPLVIAAVRFDYGRLDAAAEARLEHLNDSKRVSERRRAMLLPILLELADTAAVVVIPADQIDREGRHVANVRALASSLAAVALPGSVNLADWYQGKEGAAGHRRVEGGDRTSAAIAAASIVAKETRDRLMRRADLDHPGYGFAVHKGYPTPGHVAAATERGCLSPLHRRSVHPKAYAGPGPVPA